MSNNILQDIYLDIFFPEAQKFVANG